MKKNLLRCFILLFLMSCNKKVMSQTDSTGIFYNHSDIGTVKHPGNVSYHNIDQEYLIEGSGENIWFAEDQFHFL